MEISSDDVSVGQRHELAVLALCLFRRAAENHFQPDCKARSRAVCWQSEEGHETDLVPVNRGEARTDYLCVQRYHHNFSGVFARYVVV